MGILVCLAMITPLARGQKADTISRYERDGAHVMLRQIHQALQALYYDPTFHGVDMDARYKAYNEKLNQVQGLGQAFLDIADYLSVLHDSHTYFYPPQRAYVPMYGFTMAMIGDQCYVTRVRAGTDAATKLHPGDAIARLNGNAVNRGDYDSLEYSLAAMPLSSVFMTVTDPQGQTRTEAVETSWHPTRIHMEYIPDFTSAKEQWKTVGHVFVWKIPAFAGLRGQTKKAYKIAETEPAIVLDLRGTPGGEVDSLRNVLGYFIRQKTELWQRVGRHGSKTEYASPHGTPYAGKLYVLINSNSASGAELFARIVQLNHLGTVIGDRSAGLVMEAAELGMSYAPAYGAGFGLSVTIANLIMSDGQSLEGHGVVPDVAAVPTAAQLAAGEDPVLAKAVELAGGTLTAKEAKAMFPYQWEYPLPKPGTGPGEE